MRTSFLVLHIAGGSIALLAGLLAMLWKKGSRKHKVAGLGFFWGMTAVFVSAIYLSVVSSNAFLLMISFFSYQLTAIGYRSVFLKNLYTGAVRPQVVDWVIGVVPALFNALILFWGARLVLRGVYFGVVGIVFGVIGALYAYTWMKSFFVPPREKQYWLFSHFQSFGAAYIAAFTAFVVVNVNFLPPLLVWLFPSLVGGFIIAATTRKYKKKFLKSRKS